tara:strand:+ start:193 stop:351 length:159 start_codon:yes stop_codon:yes gene_type:complete
MIEKKVSNAGYQSNKAIKYGEIEGLIIYILIKIYPIKKPKRYEPESPIKSLL